MQSDGWSLFCSRDRDCAFRLGMGGEVEMRPPFQIEMPPSSDAGDAVAACLQKFHPGETISIAHLIARVRRERPSLVESDAELADLIARHAIRRGNAIRFS
jgi:hypothetical protein